MRFFLAIPIVTLALVASTTAYLNNDVHGVDSMFAPGQQINNHYHPVTDFVSGLTTRELVEELKLRLRRGLNDSPPHSPTESTSKHAIAQPPPSDAMKEKLKIALSRGIPFNLNDQTSTPLSELKDFLHRSHSEQKRPKSPVLQKKASGGSLNAGSKGHTTGGSQN